MEEEKGCSTTARWNPTKEQISMLEAMYKQGIRTPTAEQIQQIAGKLREFGSIEGKNVFYWFQNHKARQRQKQKQETIACFNRFLRRSSAAPPLLPHPHPHPHPHPPVHVPPPPYYYNVPRRGFGYYPHYPPQVHQFDQTANTAVHETLQLFPVHPTGILEERSLNSSSADHSSDCGMASEEEGGGVGFCSRTLLNLL